MGIEAAMCSDALPNSERHSCNLHLYRNPVKVLCPYWRVMGAKQAYVILGMRLSGR